MNLRKQLLLISLLTLVLPWAGCQFVRETESALRSVQAEMLSGTAKAIADSFSQFHFELLADTSADNAVADRLYAHGLRRAPLIDGYAVDWALPPDAMGTLRGTAGSNRYVVGAHDRYWYLFVDVRDAEVVFADSTANNERATFADRIVLLSVDDSGEKTTFEFQAEAPGKLVPVRVAAQQKFAETRILAHWQDTAGGYSLEARIPRSLVDRHLGLTVINTDDPARSGTASANFSGPLPGSLVTASPLLESVARGHVQDGLGLRLIVTDKDGWRLAQVGTLARNAERSADEPSGWRRILYGLLLEPGADTELAEPAALGREDQDYIKEALQGSEGVAKWFRNRDTGRAVVSVAQPVWSGGVQTGAIVLQQGTDAILSLTNQVLTRLIVLTLVATAVVAIVLLGYATWLSLRIQRLSNAAELALDERKLQSALPSSRSGDEVGDLSRSFSSVLRQLGTYNEYLQSLASKLSHELRTPLTIVRSSLENLEHEPLSTEALEYTARAREGTDRLQKILAAMSEANRIEELIENAETENFDLANVLGSTVSAYADAWPEREFEFKFLAEENTLYGSPELIVQMLDKLADNAVDFTSAGDTIGVTVVQEAEAFVITVTNPGPPLPEDMHARLFNSMVSVRRGDPGRHLGLGLHIARLIAEGHGGSIEAANTLDGVAFRVRLPAARPQTLR